MVCRLIFLLQLMDPGFSSELGLLSVWSFCALIGFLQVFWFPPKNIPVDVNVC